LEDEVCEILRVALDKEDEACDPVTR
jgi:hypothetical protein